MIEMSRCRCTQAGAPTTIIKSLSLDRTFNRTITKMISRPQFVYNFFVSRHDQDPPRNKFAQLARRTKTCCHGKSTYGTNDDVTNNGNEKITYNNIIILFNGLIFLIQFKHSWVVLHKLRKTSVLFLVLVVDTAQTKIYDSSFFGNLFLVHIDRAALCKY